MNLSIKKILLFVTISRILFGLIGLILVELRMDEYFFLTCIILVELSDFLDGRIARRFNIQSTNGALLDSYADSIARTLIYIALYRMDYISLVIPVIMFFRDISVGYIRIYWLSVKNEYKFPSLLAKLKGIIQGISAIFLVILHILLPREVLSNIEALITLIVIIVTLISLYPYLKK